MMEVPKKPRPTGARKLKGPAKISPSVNTRHGYAITHDNVQIFYSLEGSGEPLVFCYGLVCSSLHWTYQIDHFKNESQAIWFDYRGHHNSSVPKDLSSLTISNFARDLEVVFNTIGLKKAVLIGHSMGSSVALEFYRQFPDRVKALVLANGTAKQPLETLLHNPNIIPSGFNLIRQAYLYSPALFAKIWNLQKGNALMRLVVKLAGFNPHLAADEDVERYVSQIEEMDPGVLLNVLEAYQNFDTTSWLHTVRVPTLILSGDEDKVTPPEQQQLLHQLIPGSKIEKIRHGSHCPQMDQPEMITGKIEEFLKSISN
ncbi:MAG: alpha/beta hydrolase [Bdellovibrionales bacterium]|nr:alpha/beta hydrolase [Bdellovibrionales bacterium]